MAPCHLRVYIYIYTERGVKSRENKPNECKMMRLTQVRKRFNSMSHMIYEQNKLKRQFFKPILPMKNSTIKYCSKHREKRKGS